MDYLKYTIYILLCAAYCVLFSKHYTPHTVFYKQCEINTMYHKERNCCFVEYITYNIT